MLIVSVFIQVFNRLQKLQLCLSPKGTLNMLDKAGVGYDDTVWEWWDSLMPRLIADDSQLQVCIVLLIISKLMTCNFYTNRMTTLKLSYNTATIPLLTTLRVPSQTILHKIHVPMVSLHKLPLLH